MKNKQKILNMVKFSTLAAITFLLSMVPQLGFIIVGPGISFTTVHIPVLVGAILLPLGYVAALGFVFGLGSWIASFIYAQSPADFAFQNPAISVLPRIVFAIAAFFIIILIKKMTKDKKGPIISLIILTLILTLFTFLVSNMIITITQWSSLYVYLIAGLIEIVLLTLFVIFILFDKTKIHSYIPVAFIVSTFFHSILVLSILGLMKPEAFGESADIFGIIISSLSFNGAVEAMLAALIGTPIVVALFQLEEREEEL